MSGSGKGVSGMVGISWNGSRAGTFPDTISQNHTFVEESGDVGEEVEMDEFI